MNIRRRSPLRRSQKPIPRRRRGPRASDARACAKLWSEKVRAKNGGRCVVNSGYDGTLCQGRIEAAHCFTKKAHPSVRYELWAGEPLCAYHHLRFGNGEEWRDFLRFFHWGSALYWERYALACQTRKLDLRAVRASLESGEATE